MLIDDVYNEIILNAIKNRRNISESKILDSEIIIISIVGETLTIDINLISAPQHFTKNATTSWNYFSQLSKQFNINRILAKSKLGLMIRIILKILAHNL